MPIDNTLANTSTRLCHSMHLDEIPIKVFGFWIYIMSDCIIFCCLFATYAVLVKNTANGPISKDIFELPFVLFETMLLLLSSITCSIVELAMHKNKAIQVIYYLLLTLLCGASFIGMEFHEFYNMITNGIGPDRSGFLSAFFALVGTHGLHVISGLIWMAVLIFQVSNYGLTYSNNIRVMCLSMFWHFLDILWICIFSFVYLMGAM